MDEKILKTLYKRATGYTKDEVVEEYSVTDGEMELGKRKVTKKYYPPDNRALKAYMELSSDDDLSKVYEETLIKEKTRLLKELKEKENGD